MHSQSTAICYFPKQCYLDPIWNALYLWDAECNRRLQYRCSDAAAYNTSILTAAESLYVLRMSPVTLSEHGGPR